MSDSNKCVQCDCNNEAYVHIQWPSPNIKDESKICEGNFCKDCAQNLNKQYGYLGTYIFSGLKKESTK